MNRQSQHRAGLSCIPISQSISRSLLKIAYCCNRTPTVLNKTLVQFRYFVKTNYN